MATETRDTLRSQHPARRDHIPYMQGMTFGYSDGRIAGFTETLDKTLRFINDEVPYAESRQWARGYAYALLMIESRT